MRGYGRSSAPEAIEDYDIVALCGDLCGLLDACGERSAAFVGHDWGAIVVWQLALLHPERVAAVAGLSVPFVPRTPVPPVEIMRSVLGEDFYIVRFQEPGVADAELAQDVRRHAVADACGRDVTNQAVLGRPRRGDAHLPAWISEEELAVYVEAFERTGFTGGLNWYRNFDRNWELTELVADTASRTASDVLDGRAGRRAAVHIDGGHDRLGDRPALAHRRAGRRSLGAARGAETVNGALLEFLGGL